jgi:hypothetical protein
LELTYEWKLNNKKVEGKTITPTEVTEDNITATFEITKSSGTGKFVLYAYATDSEGNTSDVLTTNEYYIDNSITTPGTIVAKIGNSNGETYYSMDGSAPTLSDDSNWYDNGNYKTGYNNTIQGDYTTKKVYISLVDGKDSQSGIKSTSYKIIRESTVVEETTSDVLIEESGIYNVIVTTEDILGNSAYMVYTIKITSNPGVTFKDTDDTVDMVSQNANLTISTSNMPSDAKISYTLIEVDNGETEADSISKAKEVSSSAWKEYNEEKGISITGKSGNYRVVLKIEYPSTGETIYKASSIYTFDNKVDSVATLKIKETNENGADYKNYTNKNVYIRLNDDAKDSSGVLTSWYTVSGNDKVTDYSSKVSATLTEEGKYTVTVHTQDSLGNEGTRKYTVIIDRTVPEVTFPSKNNTSINVKITEENEFDSGIKDSIRYLWTKNPSLKEADVTKADFYGAGEGTYKGSIKITSNSSTTATIKLPEEDGYSGNWYLWVYAEDNAGNVVIKAESTVVSGDNTQGTDREAPIAGEINATYVDGTETKEYKFNKNTEGSNEGSYTNSSVTVTLTNGYDSYSAIKSNTATIKKGSSIVKTISTDEKCELTEDGTYTITVTTIDGSTNQNKSTATYIVKIDKTAPTITITKADSYEIDKYATAHKVKINVADTASGVNTSTLKYAWVESSKLGKSVTQEILKTAMGSGTKFTNGDTISTPSGKTGIYELIVYAEDNCGNGKYENFGEFKLDNTNPTKPSVSGIIVEKVGTQDEEVVYYGETTSSDVIVRASGSTSESGVDKYQYKITTDGGANWTGWTDCTKTKDNVVYGEQSISNNGTTIIKFRSVSVLEDTSLYSEESKEFVVSQDKQAPTVTFDKNGQTEKVESIEVTVSVTDNKAVNANSLKYVWLEASKVGTTEELKTTVQTGTIFINGAKIKSPEDAEGEYVLVVYAEDVYGNVAIVKSNTYNLGKLDTEKPTVTFTNLTGGEDGDIEKVTNVKVRVTVTDNVAVNENSLKYGWVKFESKEAYETFTKSNKTVEELETMMSNVKAFSNGEPVVSDTGLDGIYSLFIVAEDKAGNKTVAYSNIYNIGTTITAYEYENAYIKRVSPSTSVETFISIVKEKIVGTEYKLYDKKGNEITGTTLVTTASKLVVDGNKTYTIIVTGDTNSDGKVTISDLVRLKKHILKEITLANEELLAGDVNADGKISISDIVKERKALIKMIEL